MMPRSENTFGIGYIPQYIRPPVPNGTFFFTVTRLEGRRKLSAENNDNLRMGGR
jgi:hypothetical protein